MTKSANALRRGEVDIYQLIMSQALKSSYKIPMPHSECAKRMRERDPGSAPVTGSRVPYVFIKGAMKTQAYYNTEDPLFVIENNIPIDYDYYLNNKFLKPLRRLFKYVVPEEEFREAMYGGDEARHIVKTLPSAHTPVVGHAARRVAGQTNTQSSMMRFVKKYPQCLRCKTPMTTIKIAIGGVAPPVCEHCAADPDGLAETCLEQMAKLNSLQQEYSRLYTGCQRCQGSLGEINCINGDCPVFYRRYTVRASIHTQEAVVKRFDDW
jgi:DNA polymerase delta subunit 1